MIELTEFEVKFQFRPSIKAQILTDFIIECTILKDPKLLELTQEEDTPVEQCSSGEPDDLWVVNVDGSSNSAGSEAGLLLLGPEGFIAEYVMRFDFSVTNNEANYEALLVRLRISKKLGVRKLRIYTDS